MTAQQEAEYLVNAYSDPIVIRINGRAGYMNAAPLKDFLHSMIDRGQRRFLFDFRTCTGMDSTVLGILAGAGLKLRKLQPRGRLALCRLGPRNMELVRNLGLHRLAEIVEAPPPEVNKDMETISPEEKNTAAAPDVILQAHEDLCEMDAGNNAKFQDVIAFMKNQVDRGEGIG